MRKLKLARLMILSGLTAFGQFPVLGPGGGGGSSTPVAYTPYSVTFAGDISKTVTLATHGQGTTPWVYCDISGVYEAPSIANSSGDITITFGGAKTGTCQIMGGGQGATGDTGATGAAGATGATGAATFYANTQTGTTYTVLSTDCGKNITFSNASGVAVTLPQAGSGGNFADGCVISVKNIGSGDVVITPTTSTISGAASITLSLGEYAWIISNGTNYESNSNRYIVGSGLSKTAARVGSTLNTAPEVLTLTSTSTVTNKTITDSTNSIGPNALKNYVAGGGTAQAQTVTLSPALPAYTAGAQICWLPTAANTAADPTLNVNSLGAKTVKKYGTGSLVANDLTTTAIACAIYDGTNYQLQNPQTSTSYSFDPLTTSTCVEEFMGNAFTTTVTYGSCTLQATITGAGASFAGGLGESDAPGFATLTMGTTTTGNSYTLSKANTILFGGAINYTFWERIRVPTLSDGTDTFSVGAGFLDIAAGVQDGCYFRYGSAINSGKWQLVCVANSTETTADSGITVAANTWYKLKVAVTGSGTSAAFTIDGSVVGTITTNIPTAAARYTAYGTYAVKSAGTTSRTVDVDVIGVQIAR